MASVPLKLHDILSLEVSDLKKQCNDLGIDITNLHLKPALQAALVEFHMSGAKPSMMVDKNLLDLQLKLKKLELMEKDKQRDF